MASVTEMPPSEAAETAQPTAQSEPKPAKPGRGRPAKGTVKPPEVKNPQFFARVASIPREDWGTRAFMYVYVEEPVCNAKTWGETRYILKSSQPILDLEPLKQQYGSFKGWMSLNTRATGKDNTDEVDRLNFEIFDPLAPPKIPIAAWANDARNQRWRALLPPEKPPASDAAASLRDAMGVLRDVKAELREEMPVSEPANGTRETLETMKIAKELFAPAATTTPATPAESPLSIATELAKTFMQMKADNPMVDFLTKQMDRQHEELMAMRKEMAEREKTQPKGLLEQAGEFAAVVEKFEPLKKLFGFAGAAETVTRAGRTTALDVTRELGSKFFDSDLARGVGQWLGSLATRNQQPTMNGTAQANGAQRQQISDPFQRFIVEIVNPKMLLFFNDEPDEDGGRHFADWLYAGFPEYFERLQNFTHPAMPGLQGAAAILMGYKNTPEIWSQIRPEREVAFSQYVNAFCAWKPLTDADEAQDVEVVSPAATGETVDFDAQYEGRPS